MIPGEPGEEILPYSVAPVRAVKIPDEVGSPINKHPPSSFEILREVNGSADADTGPLSADHMHILVAEDDPVNSKILKKRLEKIGHEIYLTINGEECASAFGDQPEIFDVVLMDMQVSSTSSSTKNSPRNSTHLPSYRCPSSTASHPPK